MEFCTGCFPLVIIKEQCQLNEYWQSAVAIGGIIGLVEKVDFEKNGQTTKKHEKLPRGQRVGIFVHVWVKKYCVFMVYTALIQKLS